jgi:hypothetical protein
VRKTELLGSRVNSGTCPECGKQRFLSRKGARDHAKRELRGIKFAVYPCGEYWHYGHAPYSVRRGYMSRSEL